MKGPLGQVQRKVTRRKLLKRKWDCYPGAPWGKILNDKGAMGASLFFSQLLYFQGVSPWALSLPGPIRFLLPIQALIQVQPVSVRFFWLQPAENNWGSCRQKRNQLEGHGLVRITEGRLETWTSDGQDEQLWKSWRQDLMKNPGESTLGMMRFSCFFASLPGYKSRKDVFDPVLHRGGRQLDGLLPDINPVRSSGPSKAKSECLHLARHWQAKMGDVHGDFQCDWNFTAICFQIFPFLLHLHLTPSLVPLRRPKHPVSQFLIVHSIGNFYLLSPWQTWFCFCFSLEYVLLKN